MTTITDATRWAALPNGSDGLHVVDIIVDQPEGGHVASVISFQTHGEACAATWAHASLIAAAPLLLFLLRQARAALPDPCWGKDARVSCGLVEKIDAAIGAAATTKNRSGNAGRRTIREGRTGRRRRLQHPVRRRKGKGLRPALRAPLPRQPGRGARGVFEEEHPDGQAFHPTRQQQA